MLRVNKACRCVEGTNMAAMQSLHIPVCDTFIHT